MDPVRKCSTCEHKARSWAWPNCNSCANAPRGEWPGWEPRPGAIAAAGNGQGERPTVPAEALCEDEGCDHFGTPHVCRSVTPKAGTSDGGSTGYYKLPSGATDLQDLIEHKRMSFGRGNIFKAAYRLGEKDAATEEYDLRKIVWFAQRRLKELGKDA